MDLNELNSSSNISYTMMDTDQHEKLDLHDHFSENNSGVSME